MTVATIVQARVSSRRLPGKVLSPVLGQPVLLRQIERIQRSKRFGKLLIATSTDESDDPIAALCRERNLLCYRGSLDDVLDRFYHAASSLGALNVVRITADCPLLDWEIMDSIIDLHLDGQFDYTSNAIERTLPDGLDVEIMRFDVLRTAWLEAKLPSQREHVTPFINRDPKRFKLGHYKVDEDFSSLRWTMDEPEDLELVRAVYEALYQRNPAFTWKDVLEHLGRNPHLKSINAQFKSNEGYYRSLAVDQLYLNRQGGRE